MYGMVLIIKLTIMNTHAMLMAYSKKFESNTIARINDINANIKPPIPITLAIDANFLYHSCSFS